MSDSLEYILACQICLDDFEETGDHVPRILPCTHSLCEKCLKQLIEGNFVECPECRKKHRVVDNEVKTFPQNKYILANVRRKEADTGKNVQTSETLPLCERHGKELLLYCVENECLISICLTCLSKHHRGHDVVEIEVAKREALFKKIDFVKDLKERKGNILKVKKNIEEDNMECVKKMTARKKELIQKINQRYEQMLAEVKQKGKNDHFTEELTIIEEHLNLLKNVEDNVDKEIITQEEIKATMETVTSLEESIEDQIPSKVEYKLLGFVEGWSTSADDDSSDDSLYGYYYGGNKEYGYLRESTEHLRLARNVRYTWKVVESRLINTYAVTPVDGNCIAMLDEGETKLVKYRGCFEKIQEIQLNNRARNIVAVELAGRSCLAITYKEELIDGTIHYLGNQKRIEFRDAKDLNTVVLDHSVAPEVPGMVCASSQSSLWYQSGYSCTDFFGLHELNSSSSPCLTQFEVSYDKTVYDICCAELKGSPLLVTVKGYIGVTAYNTNTEEEVWSIRNQIPFSQDNIFARGITADQHGRLFVLDDKNKSIHVFSVNGKYVTTLLRKGEQGIGEMRKIRWSEGLSGLIVVHSNSGNTQISIIKIQSYGNCYLASSCM